MLHAVIVSGGTTCFWLMTSYNANVRRLLLANFLRWLASRKCIGSGLSWRQRFEVRLRYDAKLTIIVNFSLFKCINVSCRWEVIKWKSAKTPIMYEGRSRMASRPNSVNMGLSNLWRDAETDAETVFTPETPRRTPRHFERRRDGRRDKGFCDTISMPN